MAFPPFKGSQFFSSNPAVPTASSGQKFGFFSQTPVRPINFNIKKDLNIPIMNPAIMVPIPTPASVKPPSNFPITTVFVGNITEMCSNDLIQKILKLCGTINNWKRLQDTNSKYKAFGFCDYNHPSGTLRALRILNKFQFGDKKLTVKTDDATSKMLQDFTMKNGDDSSPTNDENTDRTDEQIIESINALIKEENPDLIVAIQSAKDADDDLLQRGRSGSRSRSDSPLDRSLSSSKGKENSKRSRKRSRSFSSRRRSRSTSRRVDSRGRRSSSPESRRRRSDSSSSGASSSSCADSDDSVKRKRQRKSRHRTRSHSLTSEDSDVVQERRRLRQDIKRKEQSYMKRLEKWEERERRMAKQYEKDEQDEVQRKKMLQREAKKLRQFLEDYEDERDDLKYYKSSSLFQRRKNYEREREEDAKDRQEELHEIEELKKQILAENKNVEDADAEARKLHEAKGKEKLRCIRSHSGSPTPHRPLGQPLNGVETKNSAASSNEDTNTSPKEQPNSHGDTNLNDNWTSEENATIIPDGADTSNSSQQPKSGSKLIATLQKPSSISRPAVFGDDDEEEEQLMKKKIKPFEITREDRIQAMTPEERKKLIKDLIERIPTAKNELFAFSLCWEYVDDSLIEKRVRPWINKKICEYIGDEEPSLVTFICEKITGRTEPKKILGDLAMVLDDEAEVFMIKLWRLIIYESEAKKLGLSVLPNSSSGNGNSASGNDSAGRT